MEEVFYAPYSKGIVAAGLTAVVELFNRLYLGNINVLYIWMCFVIVDYLAGTARAIVWREWDWETFRGWARKFFLHFGSIAMVNFLCWSFTLTSGAEVPIVVNFYVFMLTLTESVSIISNLEGCGWEVPELLKWIVCKWRKKALRVLSSSIGDGDISGFDLEETRPTGCRRAGSRPDNGRRRRVTDGGVQEVSGAVPGSDGCRSRSEVVCEERPASVHGGGPEDDPGRVDDGEADAGSFRRSGAGDCGAGDDPGEGA